MAQITGTERIEKALLGAFERWTKVDINYTFWGDQFKNAKWDHSPLTIRANGEPVGSPRDIYDLGDLYRSGIRSYQYQSSSDGSVASWHWDAKNRSGQEYAWYVHEGEGTNEPYERRFTDDVSDMAFSFRKPIGKALLLRVQASLTGLNAN
jgi:hypothetical protein